MLMRLRFPELLEEHDLTAYEVAKRSNKRISRSWAYRAKKLRGKLGTFGAVELEALCDVFGVEPHAAPSSERARAGASFPQAPHDSSSASLTVLHGP
jgi:hypothetical protein